MLSSRTALVAVLSLNLNIGCVTLTHPRGDWIKPVELPLDETSLEGARIGMECGEGQAAGRAWHPAIFDGCRALARLLQGMGAKVSGAPGLLPKPKPGEGDVDEVQEDGQTSTPVDFTVRYVDRNHSRDYCGWTLPLFILSFSLFPCVEDVSSAAEIQLVHANGSIDRVYPLRLDVTSIYGPIALYYLALRGLELPQSSFLRQQRQERALIQYSAGLIYNYRLRAQLSTAEVKG